MSLTISRLAVPPRCYPIVPPFGAVGNWTNGEVNESLMEEGRV